VNHNSIERERERDILQVLVCPTDPMVIEQRYSIDMAFCYNWVSR